MVTPVKFDEFLKAIDDLKTDAHKAYVKGNKAAARRTRISLLNLKNLIKDARVELLEICKEEKTEQYSCNGIGPMAVSRYMDQALTPFQAIRVAELDAGSDGESPDAQRSKDARDRDDEKLT